jgi:hypothetical protein
VEILINKLIAYIGSREQVAKLLGVTPAAIGEWVRGRYPDARSRALIKLMVGRYQIRSAYLSHWLIDRPGVIVHESMTASGPTGKVNVTKRWTTEGDVREQVAQILVDTMCYDWIQSNDVICFFKPTMAGGYKVVHIYHDGVIPRLAHEWAEPLIASRWRGKTAAEAAGKAGE